MNKNPYNYESKDWSTDIEGFRRKVARESGRQVIDYSDPNFVPGEETRNGVKGRIVNHVWTPY